MLAEMKESFIDVLMHSINLGRKNGTVDDQTYVEALETATDIRAMDEDIFYKLVDKTTLSWLHIRIDSGAKYIASIGEDHPNYQRALSEYDKLCREYEERRDRNDI